MRYLLYMLHAPEQYHHIFYKMPYNIARGGSNVAIDCGAHAGLFSELCLNLGCEVFAFEPNIYTFAHLKNRFKGRDNITLFNEAIGTSNTQAEFLFDDCVGEGSRMGDIASIESERAVVKVVDFCEFVENLVAKFGRIHVIKIDVEGAEFDILDRFIDKGLFRFVDCVLVETHERYFTNPSAKINALKNKIRQANATNIALEWV